ncbi:hypothetical protein [Butyricimonas paravirosa]
MKTTLLILLLSVIVFNLNAQKIRKDTIKGENASYYQEIRFGSIKMRNIQNKDTLINMYYNDGKQVPGDLSLESRPKFTMEDAMKIFKDTFTSLELDQLKTTRGAFNIFVAVDKNGNIIEIEFTYPMKNPVLSTITADRLFEMETKYKRLLKWNVIGNDRKIKHLKFLLPINIFESTQM